MPDLIDAVGRSFATKPAAPRDAGLIDEGHVYAELHEREKLEAVRQGDPDAVTLFKSVGHVALDLAAVESWFAQPAAR